MTEVMQRGTEEWHGSVCRRHISPGLLPPSEVDPCVMNLQAIATARVSSTGYTS